MEKTDSEVRDAVLLAGGIALVAFGAGLILRTRPSARPCWGASLRWDRSAAASVEFCRMWSVT